MNDTKNERDAAKENKSDHPTAPPATEPDLTGKIIVDEAEWDFKKAQIDTLTLHLSETQKKLDSARQVAVDAVGLIALTLDSLNKREEAPRSVRAGFASIARHLNERIAELDAERGGGDR
jgi:hypothetical protein